MRIKPLFVRVGVVFFLEQIFGLLFNVSSESNKIFVQMWAMMSEPRLKCTVNKNVWANHVQKLIPMHLLNFRQKFIKLI